ncbi:MAG: 4Fe-4S dicluster domain-containing protein [Thaumarchaeota archaeon]|nr:4Fe-4S dicluster domain-containing protein [Candidatus Calditenuaceae archaeon]MDW8041562.1 4Fe-4S dicluster domain-containing protein [Nitrososphaerota archaeon]
MYQRKSVKIVRRLRRLNGNGWAYHGLPGLQWEIENSSSYDRKLMSELTRELLEDFRIHEFYHACINCGNCTSRCPAFRFADFSPRVVVQKVMHAKSEPDLIVQMLDQYIWACFQCYSCWDVCPAHNNPGGLIAMMKELAVKHGLQSASKALEPYSRVLFKLMTTGTQITPDMHSSIAPFRDWGPHKAELVKHLREERAAVPVENLAKVMDRGWNVDAETIRELLIIEKEAGVIDAVKSVLKDVGEMVDETRAEYGVE